MRTTEKLRSGQIQTKVTLTAIEEHMTSFAGVTKQRGTASVPAVCATYPDCR